MITVLSEKCEAEPICPQIEEQVLSNFPVIFRIEEVPLRHE